jgi:hypothetical protein
MDTTPRFIGLARDNNVSDVDSDNNSFTLFNNLYSNITPEKNVINPGPKSKKYKELNAIKGAQRILANQEQEKMYNQM